MRNQEYFAEFQIGGERRKISKEELKKLLSESEGLALIKALIIIPASLIGNWQKEIEKFTPEIIVSILHGKESTDIENSSYNIKKLNLIALLYGAAGTLLTILELISKNNNAD